MDDAYLFHQTPAACARDLIATLPLDPTDVLYEPFKGEGAFYDAFPADSQRLWTEITQGRDYKDMTDSYDWVITNPPFQLETTGRRVNAFWELLNYFSDRARKGIAFLGNDNCFAALTPKRITQLQAKGWFIHAITVVSVKKWRGRYFWVVFRKAPCPFYNALTTNY
jgi:hypothetical protein